MHILELAPDRLSNSIIAALEVVICIASEYGEGGWHVELANRRDASHQLQNNLAIQFKLNFKPKSKDGICCCIRDGPVLTCRGSVICIIS